MKINETHIGKTVYHIHKGECVIQRIDTMNNVFVWKPINEDGYTSYSDLKENEMSAEPWPAPVEFPKPGFEVGKVYLSDSGTSVWFTSVHHIDNGLFKGIVVGESQNAKLGEFSIGWHKKSFNPTTGVTLKEYFANKAGKSEEFEGYRLLNDYEETKEGDEYYFHENDDWIKSREIGKKVSKLHRPYRRKITK